MKVTLIAHTKINENFQTDLRRKGIFISDAGGYNERQAVALTAIRTCYSANKPSEIVALEGMKYFGHPASDGQGGSDADRLFRHITGSGHTSTLEHITYTFAVEGVSRSLLAQLTRHRQASFSVQSQRYVRLGSEDRSGGMRYVTPPSVLKANKFVKTNFDAQEVEASAGFIFAQAMQSAQRTYDELREAGVPPEDARFVLPNAASCNLVMTLNLRALLEFYGKRQKGKGAQWEISDFADQLRAEVVKIDPWLDQYFGGGAVA
ncbi:thymidylate synthase [Paenibacillus jamilae]|uniref:Thymidylate synthase n=1 Tax=Paenibacillus jamilae TaxID=114136 RepID=A0ACC4ZZZ7_9BACL|nr:FAD-dependent thymidylate synthase [Paenibacillus jamilae]KTS84445.1 thymidylate synthase [Paenibacillus jamilae]